MALLDVPTPADVGALVKDLIETISGPAAETITAGQYVRLNVTTGFVELGKATITAEGRPGGIALNSGTANVTITVCRRGLVDMGDILGGLNFDQDVYLSDTDGRLADAPGSVTLIVGTVVPINAHTTADKVLRVDL